MIPTWPDVRHFVVHEPPALIFHAGAEGGDKLESIEGNGFRDIWKASCWHMLDEVTST